MIKASYRYQNSKFTKQGIYFFELIYSLLVREKKFCEIGFFKSNFRCVEHIVFGFWYFFGRGLDPDTGLSLDSDMDTTLRGRSFRILKERLLCLKNYHYFALFLSRICMPDLIGSFSLHSSSPSSIGK